MSAGDIFFKILKFIVIVGILYFVITHFYVIFWVIVLKIIDIFWLPLSILIAITFWERVNIQNPNIKLAAAIILFLFCIAIGIFFIFKAIPPQFLDNLYGEDY